MLKYYLVPAGEVNTYLKDGFVLWGSPVRLGSSVFQAMTKFIVEDV